MTKSELASFDELVEYYGTDVSTAQALEALHAYLKEQLKKDKYWRFKQSTKIETPWAKNWKAGSWISARTGDSAQAKSKLASMTKSELASLNELLEHYGTNVSTAQALEALHAHLKAQLKEDKYWRFKQSTKIETPWAKNWKAGVWISGRTGDRAQAKSARKSMTASELASLNELVEHYGTRKRKP